MKPTFLIILSLWLAASLAAQQDPVGALKQKAREDRRALEGKVAAPGASDTGDYTYLERLYEHLHAHPELSFYEAETSSRMAAELRQADFKVTENVGGYGVVGLLENGPGPTLLVRADMDALPVVEETGKPYASTVTTSDEDGNTVGVMHACGHDVHMTVWVGAARRLAELKAQWKGTLVFIAQPAEERGGGAKAMLDDGLYERFPLPDYAIALHVSADLPAGKVGIRSKYTLANVDMMDITVFGEGGHGAYPHTTVDPIVLAARIVLALQTIVSREISPLEPAVVTVGAIHGGAKGNVIPNEVQLKLTMRSYSDEVRAAIIEKIERICRGEAIAAGLPESKYPKTKLRNEFTPSAYNDPALTARVQEVFTRTLGPEQVAEVEPSMAGEDFSRYGRTEHKVPICIFWLGAVNPADYAAAQRGEISLPSLHNSKFAPLPEPTIRTGVTAMTAAALELLNEK
jgi:amidohydrolase